MKSAYINNTVRRALSPPPEVSEPGKEPLEEGQEGGEGNEPSDSPEESIPFRTKRGHLAGWEPA